MQAVIDKIRQTAKEWLANGEVEAVYGFAQPSVPMACRPFVARTPEEADLLWWDDFCVMNVVNFLPRRSEEKIGVVAKGCESRNLVVRHQELQLDLDNQVKVIGVPCQGMIDRSLVYEQAPAELITEAVRQGDQLTVKGLGLDLTLPRTDVLRETCRTCRCPNPVEATVVAGDPVEQNPDNDKDAKVREIEEMAPADRRTFFQDLVGDCIRCYACRDACPLCYCNLCFVDENKPQWIGKSTDEPDVLTYHYLRALHCAGRCTDCGACESACPVNIPMRLLTRKLERDMESFYDGYQAGLDKDKPLPMNAFKPDDPQDFIM